MIFSLIPCVRKEIIATFAAVSYKMELYEKDIS